MGELDGLVAIVTGAASGIGREHARYFALQGASVVANDLHDATGVVDEIVSAGGSAAAHGGDIADWDVAHDLISTATREFGHLDALVNNAGGGATALAADVTEEAWDHEIRLNLKGMFCPTSAALAWWRSEQDAGRDGRGAVVSTTSGAGLLGNVGQSPYGTAKAGVAAFTVIAAAEQTDNRVRLNAIAPAARTPAVVATSDMLAQAMRPPDDDSGFDEWHPRNIAPLAAYLCSRECNITGEIFHARGRVIGHFRGWTIGETLESDRGWTIPELRNVVPAMVQRAPDRADAGGVAYARLRDAWRGEQAGPMSADA
jgi:NAD(P)-dependent dehydrogenase (short-subunit alcohol dehydrogenase family)